MTAFIGLLLLVVAIGLVWQFGLRAGRGRDVELNRETWDVYQAARRVHAEAVAAFDELLGEARRHDQPTGRQEQP